MGIQIEIDYSWFIVFALVFVLLAFQLFPAFFGLNSTLSLLLGLLTTILFFASVLTHELSHSVVANRNNVPIKKIILFIFGGMASLSKEPTNPKVEFKIAIAGPITSLVLAALFIGLAWPLQYVLFPLAAAFEYLAIINFALAIFNLIPGYPLDGGRLFRAALWKKFGNLLKATKYAARGGVLVGYLLIVYGIFQLLVFGSLFGLIWLSFIGYFLITAARESVLQTVLTYTLHKVKVSELMSTKPLTVPTTMSVAELASKIFLDKKLLSVLVVEKNRVVGLISVDEVRKLSADNLSAVTVSEVMHRLAKQELLTENTPALKALQAMS